MPTYFFTYISTKHFATTSSQFSLAPKQIKMFWVFVMYNTNTNVLKPPTNNKEAINKAAIFDQNVPCTHQLEFFLEVD